MYRAGTHKVWTVVNYVSRQRFSLQQGRHTYHANYPSLSSLYDTVRQLICHRLSSEIIHHYTFDLSFVTADTFALYNATETQTT